MSAAIIKAAAEAMRVRRRELIDKPLDRIYEDLARAAFQGEITNRLRKLEALENAGVDNWDWYGDAMATLGSDE